MVFKSPRIKVISAASFLTTGLHVKHTPRFNRNGNIATRDNAENGIIYNAASGKWAEKIQENVVIAPWWSHDIFDNMNFKIEQVSEKVYNFYKIYNIKCL